MSKQLTLTERVNIIHTARDKNVSNETLMTIIIDCHRQRFTLHTMQDWITALKELT